MTNAARKLPSKFPPSASEDKQLEGFLKTKGCLCVHYHCAEVSTEKKFPLSSLPYKIKIMNSNVVADEIEDVIFRMSFGGYEYGKVLSVELNLLEFRGESGANVLNFLQFGN